MLHSSWKLNGVRPQVVLGCALLLIILQAPIPTQAESSDETESLSFQQYCNMKDIIPGAEGLRRADLELRKVVVVARHGDRFIMADTRLGRLQAPRLSCKVDWASVKDSDASFLSDYMNGTERWRGEAADGIGRAWRYPPYPNASLCGHTHLTVSGVEQHLRLGEYLRVAYRGKMTNTRVSATSTDYRRTYQSILAFLYALNQSDSFSHPVIRKISARHQNLCFDRTTGGCHCPALDILRWRVNAEMAGRVKKSDVDHSEFARRARRILGSHSKIDYPWKAAHDFLMQFTCHRRPLPCYRTRCFRQSHTDSLWRHLSWYFASLSVLPTFVLRSRIEMQPLLFELAQILGDSTSESAGWHVYMGHDSTIAPLAVSMGLVIAKWPPYASRFVIEAYSRQAADKQTLLRLLYEGRDVTSEITFCQGVLVDELCPLAYFQRFARENMKELGFSNWRSACDEAS